MNQSRGVSRRQFLGLAASAGVAGVSAQLSAPARATGRRRAGARGPEVAVIGGGVAGLTAAQELAERGFRVTVYERRALGGKARSIPVPGTARAGRWPLPGEHGARSVFGWYHNLPDTLRRIPVGRESVYDKLVEVPKIELARRQGIPSMVLPLALDVRPWTPQQELDALLAIFQEGSRIPPDELAYFVSRVGVFLSSSDERRLGEWEKVSWWKFIGADELSSDYGLVFGDSITGPLMAARSRLKSARATGLAAEAVLYSLQGREDGTPDRVLNGPTNEVWIDAWVTHLRRLGVQFHVGHEVTGFELERGRITAATIRGPHGPRRAHADYFVCAVPAERAVRLFGPRLTAADPQLRRIAELTTHRYHGIQFYLRNPTPIVRGHILYVDSPWEILSISQAQFWNRNIPAQYGDGRVRDILSVDIGAFDVPGIVYGKRASELRRPGQIAREVWAQLKQHLGSGVLRDDQVLGWFLDPGLNFPKHGMSLSEDQMFISTPGIWSARPSVTTAIGNLFLAADYVQVSSDLATMDGANEAARRAVGALLSASGSRSPTPEVFEPYRPPEWEALKQVDRQRYLSGQPNLLDVPPASRRGTDQAPRHDKSASAS